MSFRVLQVAMELNPAVKVGGLADVVESLSRGLAERGHQVTVLLPAYRDLGLLPASGAEAAGLVFPWKGSRRRQELLPLAVPGQPARVRALVDPVFSGRDGIYVDPRTGRDFPDAAERIALFTRGAAALAREERFDLVHLHDWQAALTPLWLRQEKTPAATVLTIHNLGYQGIFEPEAVAGLGLDTAPGSALVSGARVNFMKAGILSVDAVTTVSPRYAQEMQLDPTFGAGLGDVLRSRADGVHGILNGIDVHTWNPRRDPQLAAPYDPEHLGGKRRNTAALRQQVGLAESDRPVAGVVSRLSHQKGLDLVLAAAPELLSRGLDLVVLGSGDPALESGFRSLAAAHPRQAAYVSAFDEALAHRIQGGSDLFLMPSRYEPCGLTQMIAMRYGTVPVASGVGGLADTIRPAQEGEGTGFLFEPVTAASLVRAVEAALLAYRDRPRWERIMRAGMSLDFSVGRMIDGYEAVYRSAASA